MANQLTVDELKEELLKWQETRDFLNREIAAVEQSTTAISIWMAENKDDMYRAYFALSDALRKKDSAAFDKALDDAGELAGTVLKTPLTDGKTITEAAEKIFGDEDAKNADKAVYERLSAIPLEFPEHLYTPVETPEEVKTATDTDAPLDAVVEATAKAKIEAEKAEKAEKSSWASKMWPFGSTQKEKPADVMEKIQEVRGELLGLKTSKPFYVNSFFDWLESMHLPPEGRPEVLGDGDYNDYLTRTYRNPDYLLRQVYNDCNETLQVIFEEVCENAQAYDSLKSVFTNQDLDHLDAAITRYKDNKEIVKGLLEEMGEPSLVALALSSFDAGEKRTGAFEVAVDAAPEELTIKDKDGNALTNGTNVFDRVFELVLEKDATLTPEALGYTYEALKRRGKDKDLSAVALAVVAAVSDEDVKKLISEVQEQEQEKAAAAAKKQAEADAKAKAAAEKAAAEAEKAKKEQDANPEQQAAPAEGRQQGPQGQDGQQGADGQQGQDGQRAAEKLTPLQIAAQQGNTDIIRMLMAAKDKVDFETQSFPQSSKLTTVLQVTEKDPDKTKAVLHELFRIMGRDTSAVDFYVDMHTAITEGKTQKTGNLLKNASREMLEEWLLIRSACEPESEHAMDALLGVAKTEDARASLFQTAVSVGVPPFAPEQQNDTKLRKMKERLHALAEKAMASGKTADIGIYTGTVQFVAANTTRTEFADMISHSTGFQSSLLGKIMKNVDPEGIYGSVQCLKPLEEAFDQKIEMADAFHVAGEGESNKDNAARLFGMADQYAGDYIQSPAGDTATVLYPEKLSHIYHAYDAVGYFSGAKSGQSEAAINKENATTYINVLEKRPGYIRIGDDLLRAENWDMMIFNGQYGDLEVFKNGTDKISLSLEESRVDEVFKAAMDGKDSFVAFQDMLLLDAATFTTLRYNEAAGEVVFDQDILVSDVTKKEFDALAKALQEKNDGVYSLDAENLLINTKKVDGVYTRTLSYYDPDAPADEKEWEELTVELLVNGRTIFTKDLFGERDYGLETDISAQEQKDAALSAKIAEDIAARANFENIAEGLTVNKEAVLAVKSAEDTGMDTLTVIGSSRYVLEYLQDVAEEAPAAAAKNGSGVAKSFNDASAGSKFSAAAEEPQVPRAATKPARKSVNWVNADRILKEPFIEVKGGNFEVVVHGEEIAMKAAEKHRAAVKKTHTEVFDDFLCNKDDLCEASIYRGEAPRVVLKTGSEDVSVDVNAEDIKKAAKALGLKETVLTEDTSAGKRGKLQQAAILHFYRSDKQRSISETLRGLEAQRAAEKKNKKNAPKAG